jgi:hypothetical protein
VGHQDNDLELRAQMIAAEAAAKETDEAPAPEADAPATPLAMDHDEIAAWRKTARYFRKAA